MLSLSCAFFWGFREGPGSLTQSLSRWPVWDASLVTGGGRVAFCCRRGVPFFVLLFIAVGWVGGGVGVVFVAVAAGPVSCTSLFDA